MHWVAANTHLKEVFSASVFTTLVAFPSSLGKSALYDERLAGWRTLELQVMNHAGVRTEKLWFNFTPDRQRIRRRAANWGKNYRALPREERLAVLAAMMAVEAEDAAGSG